MNTILKVNDEVIRSMARRKWRWHEERCIPLYLMAILCFVGFLLGLLCFCAPY